MTATQLEFKKPAILEGNRDGKLPTPRWDKWGRWFWPGAALALAAGTIWGAHHIEGQVETAAPGILDHAGINSDDLNFNARYRDITVNGALPANTSADQIESILTTETGKNDEAIRNARFVEQKVTPVVSIDPFIEEPVGNEMQMQKVDDQAAIQDFAPVSVIQVAAIIENQQITLSGTVPTLSQAATLSDAAAQAFDPADVDNQLQTPEQTVSDDQADQQVSKLAMLLLNLQDNVVEAQLFQDNELLTGHILTTDSESQSELQALVAGTPVTVVTMSEPTMSDPVTVEPIFVEPVLVEPVSVELSQIDLLQDRLDLLQTEIQANIVFASASDTLEPQAYGVLEKISAAMKEFPDTSIEVGGHTDSQSSASYNIDLSERRAYAVATYLSQNGIDLERLSWNGYGESLPIVANDTPENRAKNRRVEFWVQQYQ